MAEGWHPLALASPPGVRFGNESRDEAEALLSHDSGGLDVPRILGEFDESAFDPLPCIGEFVLEEAARHMVAGTNGIYLADCQIGVARWNRYPEKRELDFRSAPPYPGSSRQIRVGTGLPVSPVGTVLGESMMRPVHKGGKIVSWVERTGEWQQW